MTARQNYTAEENAIFIQTCHLLNEIDICLIRCQGREPDLQRRPMTCRKSSLDGGLWFFSTSKSHLMNLYGSSPQVTVAVSCPVLRKCAALSGKASIVNHKPSLVQFFVKTNEALLPANYDPKHLTLLKIEVNKVDLWEWPEDKLIHSTIGLSTPMATCDQKRTIDGQRSFFFQ